MKTIDKLTPEQEELMEKIAALYENKILAGDDSYDLAIIRKGIDFIYGLAELKSPEIVVCDSPVQMLKKAKVPKGETIDNLGCGYDSGWTAFYDFFEQIGVKYDKSWGFDIWKDFILNSGVFATVLCENIAFVCIRPCTVKTNQKGELHCDNGPAIAWKDGYKEYSLNGVWVDEYIVMTPREKLDSKIMLKEKNAEVRREIVRKIGIEKICKDLNAEVVDRVKYQDSKFFGLFKQTKGDYELLLLDLGDGRRRPYLKMVNPSIGVFHIEGVHPDCKTVKEAIAWRNQTEETPEALT